MMKNEFNLKNWKLHPLNPKEMTESSLDWYDIIIFGVSSISIVFFTLFVARKNLGKVDCNLKAEISDISLRVILVDHICPDPPLVL
jgi:hypothetical protein